MSEGVRERLSALIVSAARRALEAQREDGSLPPGHNGPYGDPETPVRNTAHWCITFLAAWRRTRDTAFRVAAERACAYLMSSAARPGGGAFYCRNNPKKDGTNGLIGQAWAIEALVEAGKHLGRGDLLETASDVFCLHPYVDEAGGWRRVKLSGEPIDFDRTFNHQLWFCAAGALLAAAGVEKAAPAVRDFVSRIPRHMKLYRSGLIRHVSAWFLARRAWDRASGFARLLRNAAHGRALRVKAVGYHAFNAYAFALVHRALPDLRIGTQGGVAAALNYLISDEYSEAIGRSPYGFAYNPPGFEAAVTIGTFFPHRQQDVEHWIGRQLAESYNATSGQFDRRVADPTTSAARLYEACRLPSPREIAGPWSPRGQPRQLTAQLRDPRDPEWPRG